MENFNEATGAMDAMADSEGALADANEVYLDSIEAHVQQLRNAFTAMSQETLSKNLINDFINFAKVILQVVSAFMKFVSAIGGLRTILPLVISFFLIFKGGTIARSISNIVKHFQNFGKLLKAGFQSGISGAKEFAHSLDGVKTNAQAMGAAVNAALGVIGLIAAVISVVYSAINESVENQKQLLQSFVDAGVEAKDNAKNLLDLYSTYTDVTSSAEEVSNAQSGLCDVLGLTEKQFNAAKNAAGEYGSELDKLVANQLNEYSETMRLGLAADNSLAYTPGSDFQKAYGNLYGKTQDMLLFSFGPENDGGFFKNYTSALDEFFRKVTDDGKFANFEYAARHVDDLKDHLIELRDEFGKDSKEYEIASGYLQTVISLVGDYNSQLKEYDKINVATAAIELNTAVPKTQKAFEDYKRALMEAVYNNKEFGKGVTDITERTNLVVDAVEAFLATQPEFAEFINTVDNFTEATSAMERGIKGVQDMARGASEEVSKLDEVLKGDDWDTDLNQRVEYYKKLLEVIDEGKFGTERYKQLASSFGVDLAAPLDDQIAKIQSLGVYYNDATDGVYNFLQKVHELQDTDLAGLMSYDMDTGELWWDSAELDQIAPKLNMTREMLIGMLEAFRSMVPVGSWVDYDAISLQNWFDTLHGGNGIIQQIGDSFYYDEKRLQDFADAAGYDVEAVIATLQELNEYADIKPISLTIDTNGSVEDAEAAIEAYAQSLAELGAESQVVAQLVASALSNLPTEYIIDILANLPPNLYQLKEQIFAELPEDVQTEINANTDNADNAVDKTINKLEELQTVIDVTNDEFGLVTITVTDGGTIGAYKQQINELANGLRALGQNVSVVTQHNASGTKNAKPGLSLLGDEYSASGAPRPELVVSGDRAYLAGVNGPVVGKLNAGDVVYTYQQTKEILGSNLNNIKSIPAFSSGRLPQQATSSVANYSGAGNYSGASDSSSSSSSDKAKTWFEEEYALHNHYRKLEQETDQEYFEWLTSAWKTAYDQGIMETEDARKYEEEAYSLMKDLQKGYFEEWYNNQQHYLKMGEQTNEEYYNNLIWAIQYAKDTGVLAAEDIRKYEEEAYSLRTKNAEEAFQAEVDAHKHKVAMGQETEDQYYKWLFDAAKKAYQDGSLSLEEAEKYQEEIYKHSKDVAKETFDQRLADQQHALNMGKISEDQYYKWLSKHIKDWAKKGYITESEYQKYREELHKRDVDAAKAKFDKRLADQQHALNMGKISEDQYYKWIEKNAKNWYKQGNISADEYQKYIEDIYKHDQEKQKQAVERKLKDKQHALNMGKISNKQYYTWLDKASKAWVKSGKIDLDTYRQYQEEVYKGMQEIASSYYDNLNHRISMAENAGKSDRTIIAYDEKGMKRAEKDLAKLYKKGKTINDKEVQELHNKWWSYYNDKTKREEQTKDDAKKAMDDLINYRVKMINYELNKHKEALSKQLSDIKDNYSKRKEVLSNFYDTQKKLLQDQQDEDKYLDEQAEKRKAITDIELQLAQLEYDNSAKAQKKKLELEQNLADARKDLAEFEKDHAVEMATRELDAVQKLQEQELEDAEKRDEDRINKRIELIDEKLEDKNLIYRKAVKDVRSGDKDLYDAMVDYNNIEGSGNPADIAEMWNTAYTEMKDYFKMFGEYYNKIHLTYGKNLNKTTVDVSDIMPPPVVTIETKSVSSKTDTAKSVRDWLYGSTSHNAPGKSTSPKVLTYRDATQMLEKFLKGGYASGTRSARPGIHRVNENGDEALFKTSDGRTFRLFSGGEHVFNSAATDFLYDFANAPDSVLSQLFGINSPSSNIKGVGATQNISLGDIYINGNANDKTISEIRREKRAEMDYLLKELNRLNK